MGTQFKRVPMVLLAGLSLLVSACGFQPLYGGPNFSALPGLTIEAGPTRQDYLIEDGLRDFLGGGNSPYRLEFQTETREVGLGLSAAGRAARFQYIVQIAYRLSPPEGEPVTGTFMESVYFDAPSDPYGLLAARSDAEERAAGEVVQRLVQELAAELRRAENQG